MTDNNKFVPSTPKTYTVLELRDWQQPIKQSSLSAAARSKVVNRSGSNYVSESEGYGPCGTCGVSDKTFKIKIDLRNAVASHLSGSASDTDEAMNEAAAILRGDGKWEGDADTGCFTRANREDLVAEINKVIAEHIEGEGKAIIRAVHNVPS